jgi:hypothetical protein
VSCMIMSVVVDLNDHITLKYEGSSFYGLFEYFDKISDVLMIIYASSYFPVTLRNKTKRFSLIKISMFVQQLNPVCRKLFIYCKNLKDKKVSL